MKGSERRSPGLGRGQGSSQRCRRTLPTLRGVGGEEEPLPSTPPQHLHGSGIPRCGTPRRPTALQRPRGFSRGARRPAGLGEGPGRGLRARLGSAGRSCHLAAGTEHSPAEGRPPAAPREPRQGGRRGRTAPAAAHGQTSHRAKGNRHGWVGERRWATGHADSSRLTGRPELAGAGTRPGAAERRQGPGSPAPGLPAPPRPPLPPPSPPPRTTSPITPCGEHFPLPLRMRLTAPSPRHVARQRAAGFPLPARLALVPAAGGRALCLRHIVCVRPAGGRRAGGRGRYRRAAAAPVPFLGLRGGWWAEGATEGRR